MRRGLEKGPSGRCIANRAGQLVARNEGPTQPCSRPAPSEHTAGPPHAASTAVPGFSCRDSQICSHGDTALMPAQKPTRAGTFGVLSRGLQLKQRRGDFVEASERDWGGGWGGGEGFRWTDVPSGAVSRAVTCEASRACKGLLPPGDSGLSDTRVCALVR